MRKIKRRRLLNLKKKTILFLIVLFLITVGPVYATYQTLLTLNGTSSISTNNCQIAGKYVLKNSWESDNKKTYIADLIITNNGNEDLVNWVGELEGTPDMEVTSSHLKEVIKENNYVKLTPQDWNSTIKVNSFISIELFITTSTKNFTPTKIKINNCLIHYDEDNLPDDSKEELKELKITPQDIKLKVGDTLSLKVEKVPENASAIIKWDSLDKSIVSIDDQGKITAINEGMTKVIATSNNISAESNITVIKDDTPSSISIVFEVTGYWGSQTIQFKIIINNNTTSEINSLSFDLGMPENTTYTFWSIATNNGNNITSNNKIPISNSIELFGQLEIPQGNDPNEYLNPSITNIKIH